MVSGREVGQSSVCIRVNRVLIYVAELWRRVRVSVVLAGLGVKRGLHKSVSRSWVRRGVVGKQGVR